MPVTLASLTRSIAAAATAAVGLSLLAAAPAVAATYTHDDATGDVRGTDDLFVEGGDRFTPRAAERAADITQLRVRHGRSRLIVRLETVNLTRESRSFIGPGILIQTPSERYSVLSLADSERGRTRREVEFNGPGRRDRCPGLFTDFDFTGDVALISIPRSCIGDPQNVRLRALMLKFSADFTGRELSFEYVLDSAMDDRRVRPISSTDAIASGPMRAV